MGNGIGTVYRNELALGIRLAWVAAPVSRAVSSAAADIAHLESQRLAKWQNFMFADSSPDSVQTYDGKQAQMTRQPNYLYSFSPDCCLGLRRQSGFQGARPTSDHGTSCRPYLHL